MFLRSHACKIYIRRSRGNYDAHEEKSKWPSLLHESFIRRWRCAKHCLSVLIFTQYSASQPGIRFWNTAEQTISRNEIAILSRREEKEISHAYTSGCNAINLHAQMPSLTKRPAMLSRSRIIPFPSWPTSGRIHLTRDFVHDISRSKPCE